MALHLSSRGRWFLGVGIGLAVGAGIAAVFAWIGTASAGLGRAARRLDAVRAGALSLAVRAGRPLSARSVKFGQRFARKYPRSPLRDLASAAGRTKPGTAAALDGGGMSSRLPDDKIDGSRLRRLGRVIG